MKRLWLVSKKFLLQISVLIYLILYFLDIGVGGVKLAEIVNVPILLIGLGYLIMLIYFNKKISEFTWIEAICLSLFTSAIAISVWIFLLHSLLWLPIFKENVEKAYAVLLTILTLTSIPFSYLGFKPRSNSKVEKLSAALTSLLFLIVVGILFVVYPFIPEADPYGLIEKLKQIFSTGKLFERREVSFTWLVGLKALMPFNYFILMKYVVPITTLPIFLLLSLNVAKMKLRNKTIFFIGLLLPFTVPVLMFESIVARPQLIIMTLLSLIVYFGNRIIKKNYRLWGYFLSMLIVLLKVHELVSVFFPVFVILIFLSYRKTIFNNPKKYIVIGILFVVGAWPYLERFGLMDNIEYLVKFIQERGFRFEWWFLDSYKSLGNIDLGWPGWQFLLYYGYNLGMAVPLLLLITIRKIKTNFLRNPAAALFFMMFLIFAEVTPRFGMAFLPDRAWPYIMISAIFLLSSCLSFIKVSKIFQTLIFSISLVSIGASFFVAYAKQGRVVRDEIPAAEFLRQYTSPSSVIISLDENRPLVTFFSERTFIENQKVFRSNNRQEIRENIIQALAIGEPSRRLSINEMKTMTIYDANMTSILKKSVRDLDEYTLLADGLHKAIAKIHADRLLALNKVSEFPPDLYILLSSAKNKYLYASLRKWWQENNFIDESIYDDIAEPEFTLVYDQKGVKIWKVNNLFDHALRE